MLGVGIAEAIKSIRSELEEAVGNVGDSAIRFSVDKIEVELALSWGLQGGGKSGFTLLGIGGEVDGKVSREATHRVKFDLLVKNGNESGIDINDDEY